MLAKQLTFCPCTEYFNFSSLYLSIDPITSNSQCYFWPINDSIYYVCPFVIRSKVMQQMTGCLSLIHRLSWACKFGWKLGKKLFWLKILDASHSCWAEIEWVQVFWGFCFGFLPDREMGQYENNYTARWRYRSCHTGSDLRPIQTQCWHQKQSLCTPPARVAPPQVHVDTTFVSLTPTSERQRLFQSPKSDALCSFWYFSLKWVNTHTVIIVTWCSSSFQAVWKQRAPAGSSSLVWEQNKLSYAIWFTYFQR